MSTADRKREILKDRARALAQEPVVAEQAGANLEVVQFLLADESYAIETMYVREVYPLKEFTSVPCVPPVVLGIVNVRGQILSIVDIKKFFDLPEKGITDLNKVIIVRTEAMELGILADLVLGVRSIPTSEIQPSLPTLIGIRAEYLKGVTARRVVILNVEKILSDEKLVVCEQVET